jgi:hypothetical protein
MKFDRDYKPELIVSKDAARWALNFVELDKDERRMVATDGQRLVALPVEPEEHDTSGPIDAKTISEARKLAKSVKADKAEISCNGALKLPNGATTPRPERHGTAFPPWRQVVPAPQKPVIALNAKLLKELAEAIGQDDYVIALAFDPEDPEGPIRVYNTGKAGRLGKGVPVCDGEKDPIAVLMPCRIEKRDEK